MSKRSIVSAFVIVLIMLIFASLVYAEGLNITAGIIVDGEENDSQDTGNDDGGGNSVGIGLNLSDTSNDTTDDVNDTIVIPPVNDTDVEEEENETEEEPVETPEEVEPVVNFTVTSFVPKEFKVGEVQFNIQVQNTGTEELRDIYAVVVGNGISTYDTIPIDVLKPGEKSYIIIMANLKEAGEINVTTRIWYKMFYSSIKVIDPYSGNTALLLAEEKKKKEAVMALTTEMADIKTKYDDLLVELDNKAKSEYDVSLVSTEDLKTYLKDAQSSILHNDAEQANVSINLAKNEYQDQKKKLDSAQKIKKTFLQIIQNNAVVISTIAGAVVAMFTLWEIVKSRKDALYQKIKHVQVDKETRLVLEKKKKKSKK